MLRLSNTHSYRVPVVIRTLDIFETLRKSATPLSANVIADRTRTSRSTAYRILRTLLERGYVTQNLDGKFSARKAIRAGILPREEYSPLVSLSRNLEDSAELSGREVVELLVAILQPLLESTKAGKERRRSAKEM
jgi:DNA-binding IclR family transcriptional regulator